MQNALYLQYKNVITMTQATISIRVDQSLKRQFDSLCELFGLSTTAAFNIFMKTVVRERRIPFEIRANDEEVIRQKALEAFKSMQQTVANSDTSEMSLDEINTEIKAARDERKEKNLRSH